MSHRKKLRELIASPELLVLPGAYDALSARIIAAQGFSAVAAGGYAAIGSLLGQADMGQSNMRDYADHYGRICDAVDLPVYVDADTGFGGVHNLRQAVRAFENAGVAGMFISDQVFPNRCGYLSGKDVIAVEEMLAKVKAAVDARRDPDLFICIRTDAASVLGVDAAIERCRLFMEAGADMAKPQGLDRPDEIARALREIPGPHFATLSQAAGASDMTLARLQALGVAGVTLPSLALFAAAEGVRQAMARLKRGDPLDSLAGGLIALDDYYQLVGLAGMNARETGYADQARQTLAQRAADRQALIANH